jgi:hypothetical protein
VLVHARFYVVSVIPTTGEVRQQEADVIPATSAPLGYRY